MTAALHASGGTCRRRESRLARSSAGHLAPDAEDLHAHLNTVETPFNKLGEKELCPGAGMLEKIYAALR